jgi:hypothetical protein
MIGFGASVSTLGFSTGFTAGFSGLGVSSTGRDGTMVSTVAGLSSRAGRSGVAAGSVNTRDGRSVMKSGGGVTGRAGSGVDG